MLESARRVGYLVSQQLVAAGERVVDVPPMMASRVRLLGSGKSQKTDPNDARSVAIAALRHPGLTLVRGDDHTRVLGLLAKRHRDLARLKNKVACRLHALRMELTAGGLASENDRQQGQFAARGARRRRRGDPPAGGDRHRTGRRHHPPRSSDANVEKTDPDWWPLPGPAYATYQGSARSERP